MISPPLWKRETQQQHLLSSINKGGDIIIISSRGSSLSSGSSSSSRRARASGLSHLLKRGNGFGANLLDDIREELLETLDLGGTTHNSGPGGESSLHFRVAEVHHHAIFTEHVDLFDLRDGVGSQPFQGLLKLLVPSIGSLVDRLPLPTSTSLPPIRTFCWRRASFAWFI